MQISRFEEFPIWHHAVAVYEALDEFLDQAPPRLRSSFRAHLEDAALTLSSDVAQLAECSDPATQSPLLRSCLDATNRLRSMFMILGRRSWMTDFLPFISHLQALTEHSATQLLGWAAAHAQRPPTMTPANIPTSSSPSPAPVPASPTASREMLLRLPDSHPRRIAAAQRGEI